MLHLGNSTNKNSRERNQSTNIFSTLNNEEKSQNIKSSKGFQNQSYINSPINTQQIRQSLEKKFSQILNQQSSVHQKYFHVPINTNLLNSLNTEIPFTYKNKYHIPRLSNGIENNPINNFKEENRENNNLNLEKNECKVCSSCTEKNKLESKLVSDTDQFKQAYNNELKNLNQMQISLDHNNGKFLERLKTTIQQKRESINNCISKEYDQPINSLLSSNFGINHNELKSREIYMGLENKREKMTSSLSLSEQKKYPEW